MTHQAPSPGLKSRLWVSGAARSLHADWVRRPCITGSFLRFWWFPFITDMASILSIWDEG